MSRNLLRILTIAGALIGAPGAHAAGWVDSGPLSPPNEVAIEPHAIIAPNGERAITWIQSPTIVTPGNVSVRVAPPGGDFGPIQTFPGNVFEPQLATSADGTLALTWIDGQTGTVHLARRAPGQPSFVESNALTISGEGPAEVRLAFSGDDVFLAFTSFSQNSASMWAARLPAAGNTLQIVPGGALLGAVDHQSFANGQPAIEVQRPGLAVDGGKVFVSWERQNDGAGNALGVTTVESARFVPGGAIGQFSAPAPVDTVAGTGTSAPEVAPHIAAGGGHAYVVWLRPQATQTVTYQDIATGAPIQSIPTDPDFEDLSVAADGLGTLFVAGDGLPPGVQNNFAVSVATEPAASTATPAVRLTPAGLGRRLDDLAVASDGTALVLPDRATNGFAETIQVQASLRAAGGQFGALEEVSGIQDVAFDSLGSAGAAVAAGGRALAVWTAPDQTGTTNALVHVSERDSTPPVFGQIAVPATGTVGQRLPLTATAADALSGAATITWDFGDGSRASGASVSHAFAAAGAATVTVTATDSVGNSGSQTRVIAVSPARAVVDRTPPVISGLRFTHATFRVGASSIAQVAARRRSRKASPVGSALRLRLSKRATLVIEVDRGRTELATIVRISSRAGLLSIPFSGRIGGTALAPGRYTVAVSAIDGSGNRSKVRSAHFTIAVN